MYRYGFLMLTLGRRSTFPGIRLCKSTNLNAPCQKISKLLSSFGCFPDCSVVGRGYQLSSCWPAPEPGPPHKPLAALEYRQSEIKITLASDSVVRLYEGLSSTTHQVFSSGEFSSIESSFESISSGSKKQIVCRWYYIG